MQKRPGLGSHWIISSPPTGHLPFQRHRRALRVTSANSIPSYPYGEISGWWRTLRESVGRAGGGTHISVDPNPRSFPHTCTPCIPEPSQSPLYCPLSAKPMRLTSSASSPGSSKAPNEHAKLGSEVICEATFVAVVSRMESRSPVQQLLSLPSPPSVVEAHLTDSVTGRVWLARGATGTVGCAAVCPGCRFRGPQGHCALGPGLSP